MKTYKAKTIALPGIEEVQGELYADVNKDTLEVTGKYYLREHFGRVTDKEIIVCHTDYMIDINTLEEVVDERE